MRKNFRKILLGFVERLVVDVWVAFDYHIIIMKTIKIKREVERANDSIQLERPLGICEQGKYRKISTVQEMSARHHEIARLLVLGHKNVEIARMLNIDVVSVSTVRLSPVVKEQMKFLMGKRDSEVIKISDRIAETLPKCVDYLANTIDDDELSPSLRSKNAFGLLAAGGHGPSKNITVKGVHAILTAEDIQEIRDQAEQIGINSGIVDAEYEEASG